jgi:sarcosine oxidase subunit gamma
MAAVAVAAGVADPAVRRWEGAGDRALVWMSPDERLLICPRWDAAALAGELSGVAGLAADVSDMRAVFRVSGPGARDALAKGAPVDLSRAAFGAGDVRRTHLAETAAMIRGLEGEAFELFCFRSVEDHMARWLEVATRPGRAPAVL